MKKTIKKDDLIELEAVAPGEMTVRIKQGAEAKQQLGRRYHDVTAALRNLRFALEALQSGYKFDDEAGVAKLASMERALATLDKEAGWLQALFLTQ